MAKNITRGIRKVSENVLADGRAIIVTEKNKSKYLWNEIPDGSKFIDTVTGLEYVKLEGETDWVPSKVQDQQTLCIAKDSIILYETYTIHEIDKTRMVLTYVLDDGNKRQTPIVYNARDDVYEFEFRLEKGDYNMMRNVLEVRINDTLMRSAASGGLKEINNKTFVIWDKIEVGNEITVKYLKKINIGNPYPRFFISDAPPVDADDFDFWLDTTPEPHTSKIVSV